MQQRTENNLNMNMRFEGITIYNKDKNESYFQIHHEDGDDYA